MDLVLGLSMTSANVRLVLVEGVGGDGATIDHDAVDLATVREVAAASPTEHVVDAVLGTDAIAEAGDHHLRSIGVTWTNDAAAEARRLLDSLARLGFRNVAPIPGVEAAETLARGIAGAVGCDEVAVCIVEPAATIVSIAKVQDGTVVDGIHGQLASGDAAALGRELVKVLDASMWQPAGVYVLGSADNLDEIVAELDAVVSPPVISAAEADLALARGAAMASAQAHADADTWVLAQDRESVSTVPIVPRIARLAAMHGPISGDDETGTPANVRDRWIPAKPSALTSVFVAAVVTFVVSLSVAVGLRLAPDKDSATTAPQQLTNAAAAEAEAPVPQLPAPAAPPPLAPVAPAAEPVVVADPAPELAPPVDAALEVPPADAPVDPPVAAPVAPPAAPPPDPNAAPPPAPDSKPTLRERILQLLHHGDIDADQGVESPPPAPPPAPVPPTQDPQ